MFEQLAVVLKSYNRWSVRTLVVLGMLWLAFVYWYVQGEYLDPLGYINLFGPMLLVFFGALGSKAKSEFVPFRSRLIPHWSLAHLAVAAGLSVVVVLFLAGTAAISLHGNFSEGHWKDVSYLGMFGFLWFLALMFFSVGYFSGPAFLGGMPLVFALLVFRGHDFLRLISILVQGKQPGIVTIVILIDAVGSVALVRRMLHVDEEMAERRWTVTFDPREQQRQMWSREAPDRGIRQNISSWMFRSLDEIQRPLRQDLPSQIRHFQLGIMAPRGYMAVSVLMVLIFWTINLVTGNPFPVSDYFFWSLLGINSVFAQVMFSQRNSFQWIFMLPLRRREIVIRYFGALLTSVLKMWFSYILAIFVVQWMPFPGSVAGAPPLLSMIESFAALFPLFGIMTLVLMWPREVRAKRAVVLVLLVAVLITLIAVTIGKVTKMHEPAPVFTIAAFLTGIGLIWFSYRRWLRADLA